jgi:DNA polymerase I-like protein with 3'-5' exonuclease and polymerase domains
MIHSAEPGHMIRIKSLQEWELASKEIAKYRICGISLETTGEDPLSHNIKSISISLPNSVYIAETAELGKEIVFDLARLLEQKDIKKVIYDAKPVLAFIRASIGRKLDACNVFDLMLASQICWSGYQYLTPSHSAKNPWKRNTPDHSLASLAERHLGIILEGQGCSEKESLTLLPLYEILAELIERNDLQRIADLEFRAISSIVEMETAGIAMDSDQARRMVSQDEKEIVDLVWTMQDEARRKDFVTVSHDGKRLCYYLNPDRNEDIIAFLKRRGYAVSSTKAEIMRGLAAAGCAFAEALLCYRHVSHSLAFLNHWLERVDERDGRVHPQYFQIPSSTGRISSRNPNAQQIPRTGEDATAIRSLFSPAPGKKYVKADFYAIELRIMAYLSGDKVMREAFQEGIDLHCLTASRIEEKPLDEVSDRERQAAKVMNFLLIYGGSAKSLQWRILSDFGRFIPLDEAEDAKEKFFQNYEGVRAWQETQLSRISFTVQHHFHNCVQGFFALPLTCTLTALGRRRIWQRFGTGITASKFQMYNTPCQGTGADLIKLVMAEVYDKISSEDARIIGSIHDEILLEVPEDRAEEYAIKLKEIMERVGSQLLFPIPVKAEVKVMATLAG